MKCFEHDCGWTTGGAMRFEDALDVAEGHQREWATFKAVAGGSQQPVINISVTSPVAPETTADTIRRTLDRIRKEGI
jgi:hypothetical protein